MLFLLGLLLLVVVVVVAVLSDFHLLEEVGNCVCVWRWRG